MHIVIVFVIIALCAADDTPKQKKFSSNIVNPEPGPTDFGGESPEDKAEADGVDMTEGDMIIVDGEGDGQNRNAVKDPKRKWPKVGGKVIVPFTLHDSLDCAAILGIGKAMEDYAKYTCIHFTPKRNNDHYAEFFKGRGCYSLVGNVGFTRRYKEKQQISIGNGCTHKGTAIHEMMHAMGFQHEQSRPDRDQHVTVFMNNIKQGKENNFKACDPAVCTTQNLPYDYDSVMHYGTNYFTKNGQKTLAPKKSGATIGQRNGFSKLDIQKLNKLYDCDQASIGQPLSFRPTKMHKGQNCEKVVKCKDKYSNCAAMRRHCNQKQIKEGCPTTCRSQGC